MGSLKLPHASGNSMSIAAPATNPASDLELKLPATIGTAGQVLKNSSTAGTLEFGTLTTGKIIQVTSKQDAASYSTTGNSWYQGPQTDTFTLTNSSNKVLVTANFMLYMDARSGNYLSVAASLFRGNIASGTQITGGSQPMHYRNSGNLEYYIGFNTLQYLDTPGGNTTYSLAVKNNNNNSLAAIIKGSDHKSVITLMEVAV